MVYKVCGHFYTVQNLESKRVTQSKATLEFKDAAIYRPYYNREIPVDLHHKLRVEGTSISNTATGNQSCLRATLARCLSSAFFHLTIR